MTRHVVIGTAGHVDHGKTALVKALTGIDTDRFPEEQRRGITIDIGFAHFTLQDGLQASVVDVPGHEDFVRNMVAGATGIDLALLVVAADEGVMPQTIEHLAILDALGISAGAVAITKADLVEPEWLELVRADLAERLGQTRVVWEPPVAVSVVSSQGLETLRSSLALSAGRLQPRSADDLFRMPVDRVFSLPGAGTVVTGTTWSGSVKVGDHVSLLPEGLSGRIRSIQVHGEARDQAEPGRRTALALVGLERAATGRGSVVVSDASWRATTRIDVRLSLLRDAPRPVGQHTRLRLHLGTAEAIARVTPELDEIAPGDAGMARLRLETPVVARWGDRGVLRSYSPITTIGGFVVVDPWPAPRPRRPTADPDRESADPVVRVRAFSQSRGDGLPLTDLGVRVGIATGQQANVLRSVLDGAETVSVAGSLLSQVVVATLRREALEVLRSFHAQHPLQQGMPVALLRQALGHPRLAEEVLIELGHTGQIEMQGGRARIKGYQPVLSAGQERAGTDLLAALTAAGAEGRTLEELQLNGSLESFAELAEYYVRQGTAVRVGADRYYLRSSLDALARQALAEIARLGAATPAQLRDKLGLSRKYLIPLLEWLDLRGLTLRSGDARQLTATGEQEIRTLDATPGLP